MARVKQTAGKAPRKQLATKMDLTWIESAVITAIVNSRPNFRSDADKIAYFINCVFLVAGFYLNTTGGAAFNDDVLTTPFSYAASMDGWDEFEDRYAFVYLTPDHDSKVVVKCHLANNNQLCVSAFSSSSSSLPVHHSISINDFVLQSNDTNFTSYCLVYKNSGKLIDCIIESVLTKLEPSSKASKRKEKGYKRRSQEEEDENKDEDEEEEEKEDEEEALADKFARMRLKNKKRRKKVNYASPYKRRSVKNNNKKKNSITAGSKEEHAVTLYDLSYGIYTYMKKVLDLMEHLETHKDDEKAIARLNRYEYYIEYLSENHHLTDWKYDRTKARDDVSQCFWEKLSYFES